MGSNQRCERVGLARLPFGRRTVVAQAPLDGSEGVSPIRREFDGDGLGVLDDPGNEADAAGLVGVDHPTREREVHRVALAEDARQANRPAPRSEQAQVDARLGERRSRGRHAEVAGERQFDTSAAGRPVDAGDDDRLRGGDAVGDSLAVPGERGGIPERLHDVEVGAGAERRPRPAEEDDRLRRLDHGGFERVEIAGPQGVPSGGSVEGNDAIAVAAPCPYHAGRWRAISKGLCLSRGNLRPMDDAVLARDAARKALGDIEPDALREALYDRLDDASMTPGVLTLLSARAFAHDVDVASFEEQAAGVQLIYEGLNLTRLLAHQEPWATDLDADIDADMEVIAAEVMVSRGFYLLARTDAADRAVEVVRAFGRDQTERASDDGRGEALDRNLEADVFELAVVTGTAAADGGTAPDDLLAYADELARGYDGELPPATDVLPEPTRDHIVSLSGGVSSATDGGAWRDP